MVVSLHPPRTGLVSAGRCLGFLCFVASAGAVSLEFLGFALAAFLWAWSEALVELGLGWSQGALSFWIKSILCLSTGIFVGFLGGVIGLVLGWCSRRLARGAESPPRLTRPGMICSGVAVTPGIVLGISYLWTFLAH